MCGRPTIRALNQPCPSVFFAELKTSNSDFPLRREPHLADQLRIDLFQPMAHVAGDDCVFFGIEFDAEVLGFQRLVALEHFQHLERVVDADVEGIDAKGLVERELGLLLFAQPHQHHAQLPRRRDALRHGADRLLIVLGRRRPAPQAIERVGQRFVECSGMRVARGDFGHQLSEASFGRGPRQSVDRRVGSRHPAQRLFRARIQLQRVGQNANALPRREVGQLDVGLQVQRRQQLPIDLERAIGRGVGGGDFEFRQRQFAQGHDHVGRVRVQLQGRLELAAGLGLIVFFGIQPPRLVMRLPERGIGDEQFGVKLIDQEIELIAQPVPAGILRRGQANPLQALGILDRVLVEVPYHRPVTGVGLGQLAGGAKRLGPHPVGQKLMLIELDRGSGQFLGRFDVPPLQGQPGQLGGQRRLVGVLLGGFGERLHRLLALADRLLAAGHSQGRRDRLLGRQGAKGVLRLGIFALLEQPPRGGLRSLDGLLLGRLVGGQRHARESQRQQRSHPDVQRERSSHVRLSNASKKPPRTAGQAAAHPQRTTRFTVSQWAQLFKSKRWRVATCEQ